MSKGKIFNNIDQEYRSIAVIGLGQEGAGFNDMEMIDEGMVSIYKFKKLTDCKEKNEKNFGSWNWILWTFWFFGSTNKFDIWN